MLRATFLISLLVGTASLALAVASFFHLPITEFPTAWEIERIERVVFESTQLDVQGRASVKRSLDWIRANEQSALTVLFSLRQLAMLGFACMSALGFSAAYFSFKHLRASNQGSDK